MGNTRSIDVIAVSDFYRKETCAESKVFTLRAARKYSLDELQTILDYLLASRKLDSRISEKDAHSFRNILKAMREKSPSPTEAEMQSMQRVFAEFQKKHPEFGESYEEDE